jgi:DNA-directed RNA polymerase subunit L
MTASDLQDALVNLFETLGDARDEIEGEDDDITLADHLRDIASDFEGVAKARSYQRDQVLTTDAGLTIRTAGGAEFQITIVQSRRGRDE